MQATLPLAKTVSKHQIFATGPNAEIKSLNTYHLDKIFPFRNFARSYNKDVIKGEALFSIRAVVRNFNLVFEEHRTYVQTETTHKLDA